MSGTGPYLQPPSWSYVVITAATLWTAALAPTAIYWNTLPRRGYNMSSSPLQVFTAGELPRALDSCPLCGRPNPDLEDILLNCNGTSALLNEWRMGEGMDLHRRDRVHYTALLDAFFIGRLSHESDMCVSAASIRFVGRSAHRVAIALQSATTLEMSIDRFITNAMDLASEQP